jgi:hypothetical protein
MSDDKTTIRSVAAEQKGSAGGQRLTDVKEEIDSIRGLLFHVNNVVHTRANLLLLAESIFFAAIATLWKEEDQSLKLIICGLGIVMTVMLWFANATLYIRSNVLTEKLSVLDPIYKEYMDAVPKIFTKVTLLLTHALPAVSLIAWVMVVVVILR